MTYRVPGHRRGLRPWSTGSAPVDPVAPFAFGVVHACPPGGSGVMPCCGRTVFEVAGTDRITLDPGRVSCHREKRGEDPGFLDNATYDAQCRAMEPRP